MDAGGNSVRVLMLPWLAHGHISPFLELAKKLCDRNFHIYLCSTPINLDSVKKRLTQKYSSSIQLVELDLPSPPELPPRYHTTNGLPPHLMSTLKEAFEKASPNFSHILKTLSPDLLIYDFNQPWASALALSHNIPAVMFLIFGSTFISFMVHHIRNPTHHYPFPAITVSQHEKAMFHGLLEVSVNNVLEKDRFIKALDQSCSVVLIKSFRQLDGKYVDYLSSLAKKKIMPLGPLVQNPSNDDTPTEITQWLEKKEKSSAVFVSFGSEYYLSREEMEELALGLELSEVNFIWVVRFPAGERIRLEEALPDGYAERVGERGVVVEGWAPQAKILSHSSTGGFVTHCGWSSVMESIMFGVPIIAMPMHIDQPVNARLIEEAGVGMEIKRDTNGRLQKREIERVIREVVVEKKAVQIRNKVREMSVYVNLRGDEEIDEAAEELIKLCKTSRRNTGE